MRIVVALALVVSCAALAGGHARIPVARKEAKPASATSPSPASSSPLATAWMNLPTKGSACSDNDLGFDYGVEGGMRSFYCRAQMVMPWMTFRALAPAIFRAGPHPTSGGLELGSKRDFGRYDPAFVRWANEHLIPAATDDTLRRITQDTYNAQVQDEPGRRRSGGTSATSRGRTT
jgi:hypothetical protein